MVLGKGMAVLLLSQLKLGKSWMLRPSHYPRSSVNSIQTLTKNSETYCLWRADHKNCKANFKGSALAMEPEGTERMFKQSVETH